MAGPYAASDTQAVTTLFYGSGLRCRGRLYTCRTQRLGAQGIDPVIWCTPLLESYSIAAVPKNGSIVGSAICIPMGHLIAGAPVAKSSPRRA